MSSVFGVIADSRVPAALIAFGELDRPAFLRTCPTQSVLYRAAMTQAVANILEKIEQLSDTERRELRRAIVERVPMSDDLTDDDFAALAAASFRALDEEEDAQRA